MVSAKRQSRWMVICVLIIAPLFVSVVGGLMVEWLKPGGLWSTGQSKRPTVPEDSGQSATETVPLEGSVTVNGMRLRAGTIRFSSTDGKGTTVKSDIVDGKYSVRLVPGSKLVAINSALKIPKREIVEDVIDGKKVPRTVTIFETIEGIPAEYNTKSKLKVDVIPGSRTLPRFELVSPGGGTFIPVDPRKT